MDANRAALPLSSNPAAPAKVDRRVIVVLTLSFCVNVVLAYMLWSSLSSSRSGALPALAAGASVPPIEVLDQRGQPQTIRFDQPTLVYAFTSTCAWCKRNADSITALAVQLRQYRVVPLCLDCTAATAQVPLGSGIPYYMRPSTQTVRGLRLGTVPQTVAIARGGTVSQVWQGAFISGTRSSLEKFFGVRLPDVPINVAGR